MDSHAALRLLRMTTGRFFIGNVRLNKKLSRSVRMFAYLQGLVISSKDSLLTLDVRGVGFSLSVARTEQYETGKETKVITYLHWVQDQGPVLYGFF